MEVFCERGIRALKIDLNSYGLHSEIRIQKSEFEKKGGEGFKNYQLTISS
jgi:hypothetical protein